MERNSTLWEYFFYIISINWLRDFIVDKCQQYHKVPKCIQKQFTYFFVRKTLCTLFFFIYYVHYVHAPAYSQGHAHNAVGVCTEYSEHKVRDRPVWLFRETKQCAYRAICHTHVSAHDDILTPVLFSSCSYSNKVENSAQNKILTTTTTPCHLLRP